MTQKQIAQLMGDRGLRPTTQRLAVYDYLYRHRIHPSAEMVYDALVAQYPTFSREAFRTIPLFDTQENKVGRSLGDIPVKHMDTLEEFIPPSPARPCTIRCTRWCKPVWCGSWRWIQRRGVMTPIPLCMDISIATAVAVSPIFRWMHRWYKA